VASGSQSLPLGEKGAEKTNPGALELKKAHRLLINRGYAGLNSKPRAESSLNLK